MAALCRARSYASHGKVSGGQTEKDQPHIVHLVSPLRRRVIGFVHAKIILLDVPALKIVRVLVTLPVAEGWGASVMRVAQVPGDGDGAAFADVFYRGPDGHRAGIRLG